jgi:hypothetical protein
MGTHINAFQHINCLLLSTPSMRVTLQTPMKRSSNKIVLCESITYRNTQMIKQKHKQSNTNIKIYSLSEPVTINSCSVGMQVLNNSAKNDKYIYFWQEPVSIFTF